MKKICIIGVYFGKFPNYFDLWLKSCEANEEIDYLVFTDNKDVFDFPQNVQRIYFTLKDMNKKANEVLGFMPVLDTPYKCCDYKPLYGEIFAEYIKEYDFWGHCDFDLIWGDLKYYFEEYQLQSFDKFLQLGHLSLYRNTKENNKRYRLSGSKCGDYTEVYRSSINRGFDEERGMGEIFKKNGFSYFEKRIFADISNSYKRFRCARKDVNYKYQVFVWRKGKVYRVWWNDGKIYEEEFMYIHFQKRGYLPVYVNLNLSESFFITQKGFYPVENDEISLSDIEKYNPSRPVLYEKLEKIWSRTFGKDWVTYFRTVYQLKKKRKYM